MNSNIIGSIFKILGVILIAILIKFFVGGGYSDYSVNKKLIKSLPEPPFEYSIKKGKKEIYYWWSGKITEKQIDLYETTLKNAGFKLAFRKGYNSMSRMRSRYSKDEIPSGNIRNDSITVDNYKYSAIYESDKNIYLVFTGKYLVISTFESHKSIFSDLK